jgi:calpain-15
MDDWSMVDTWRQFKWRRVDEIYNHPIQVFNKIEPGDILQGQLGDCYFLSTLSAMAEFPKRIEKLFDTQDYQESGCYSINICTMGIWTDVVIDDYFPCYGDAVAFSGPKVEKNVTEIWVLLLEKAWAKLFGNYNAISAGFTEDVLRDLTGAPCENIMNDNPDLFPKLYDANQANYIITAASAGDEEAGDSVNPMGLVILHAYAIIDVREVQTREGTEQILMIRNPWGQTEWTGDWSDNSSKWTP